MFEEVVGTALNVIMPLDKCTSVIIDNKEIYLSVFTLTHLRDMPQQNTNSGVLGPTAAKFCRFCYVGKKTSVTAIKDIIIV